MLPVEHELTKAVFLASKLCFRDDNQRDYILTIAEREANYNLCIRTGKSIEDCRNCIQFVKKSGDNLIACGTDATIRTCYIINDSSNVPIRTFPAHDLVSLGFYI